MKRNAFVSSGLGGKVNSLRTERGWSLRKLAREAGISIGYLSQIERGERTNPSPKKLKKLAEALGTSLKELRRKEVTTLQSQIDLDNRIRRNTGNFRSEKSFQKYYDRLSECQYVVSAPGMFAVAGQFNATNGGLEVLNKLPSRVYIGLKKTIRGNLDFEQRFIFNPTNVDFEEVKWQGTPASLWSTHKENLILALCRNKLSKEDIRTFCKDHSFIMLSEVPANRGCNLTGAQAACMATIIAVALKVVKTNELKSWSNTHSYELKKDHSFNDITRFAMKVESMFFNTASGGARAVCPMIGGTTNPLIFSSESRDGRYQKPSDEHSKCTTSKDPHVLKPRAVGEHFELYDDLIFEVKRLEDFHTVNAMTNFSEDFDYGLIYTVDPKRAAGVVQCISSKKDQLQELSDWVNKEWFSDNDTDRLRAFKFLRLCKDGPR